MPVQDNISNRLVTLEGAFGRVFKEAMDWAEGNFREEIEQVKWDWPNRTVRENGSIAGTTRDIIDLGGLLSSQKRENFDEERTVFSWRGRGRNGEDKAYALYVHDGYTSKGGQKIKARPFTDNAIQQLPSIVDGLITKEVRSNG